MGKNPSSWAGLTNLFQLLVTVNIQWEQESVSSWSNQNDHQGLVSCLWSQLQGIVPIKCRLPNRQALIANWADCVKMSLGWLRENVADYRGSNHIRSPRKRCTYTAPHWPNSEVARIWRKCFAEVSTEYYNRKIIRWSTSSLKFARVNFLKDGHGLRSWSFAGTIGVQGKNQGLIRSCIILISRHFPQTFKIWGRRHLLQNCSLREGSSLKNILQCTW